MDKFRDGENDRQRRVIAKGNLSREDAALLVSDENDKLKAQILVLQASGDGVKARSVLVGSSFISVKVVSLYIAAISYW